MSEKNIYIGFVIDRSGSMEPLTNEVITGFNEQIETIKKENPKAKVTLVSFATTVKEHFFNHTVDSLEPFTKESYKPSGWTALYDGVAHTLDRMNSLPDANDPNTVFLVTVISDGMENQSKEFAGPKGQKALAEKIKKLQETGRWTITYMGANQDLGKVSRDMGIPVANTMAFEATEGGYATGQHVNKTQLAKFLRSTGVGGSSLASKNFYSKG
jgi:hypothetical protein